MNDLFLFIYMQLFYAYVTFITKEIKHVRRSRLKTLVTSCSPVKLYHMMPHSYLLRDFSKMSFGRLSDKTGFQC